MSSQKAKTSKFRNGTSLPLSLIAMIICLAAMFGVRIYAGFEIQRIEDEKRPRLELKTFLKSIRTFHSKNGRFPVDLRELEISRNGKDALSRLKNGNHNFIKNHYLYFYYGDGQVAGVWAIPQGEYKTEASTVYLVVTPTSEEQWRGPVIAPDEQVLIPPRAIPTTGEMLRLGMSKQLSSSESKKKSGNPLGGLF